MSHCDPHPSADELAVLDPASGPPKRVSPRYEGVSGLALCISEALLLAPAMLVCIFGLLMSIAHMLVAMLSTFLAIIATLVSISILLRPKLSLTRPPTLISQRTPRLRKPKRRMYLPMAALFLSS